MKWAVVLASIITLLGAAGVLAKMLSDPAVAWLDTSNRAAWIVYPSPASTMARKIVELDTFFATSFHLDAVPPSALLRHRPFRSGRVLINGREALPAATADWRIERTAEVAGLLRPGENRIEARVSNASGPPALWLVLEMPGTAVVASGEGWSSSWAGAATLPAVRATEPKHGRIHDPDSRVMPSLVALRLEWPRIAVFSLIAMFIASAVVLLNRRYPAWPVWSPTSPWPVRLTFSFVAVMWLSLFVNNSPWLPISQGFDSPAHLDYAQFVQEQRAIPFADDGWQMFQPPLYYLLLAAASAVTGVSTASEEIAVVVRVIGLAVGLTHIALLGACLRIIFPDRPRPQVLGLLIGGFLPCMLYLHQYPANEPLVAMLSTAAILAFLHLLREDRPPMVGHAFLGVLLGLALLAKASALLLVALLIGALTIRAFAGHRQCRTRRLVAAALSSATLLITCGWYFARVWRRFGTPFVGGWDERRRMGWWMDPGYRTTEDFLRFGRAFTAPLFAGFDGFWDGLYATLWGDGLLSGAVTVAVVPPWWSPSLMSASLLLAILPTVAVLGGAFVVLVRRHDATTGVLVALAFVVFISIVTMSIRVPAVAANKASYGLLALLPLCVFGAYALDLAAGNRIWLGVALTSFLGTWALTSYATYRIDASSAQAHLLKGSEEMQAGDPSRILANLQEAHTADPNDWSARVLLARHLLKTGGPRPVVEHLLAADEHVPGFAFRHIEIASMARQSGDYSRAETSLRRALMADPDNIYAQMQIASLRMAAGDPQSAVSELREVLRIDPQHHASHATLASLYQLLGDQRAAELHQTYAERVQSAR